MIHRVNDGRQVCEEIVDEAEIYRRAEIIRRLGMRRWREFDWYTDEDKVVLESRMLTGGSYPISSGKKVFVAE